MKIENWNWINNEKEREKNKASVEDEEKGE